MRLTDFHKFKDDEFDLKTRAVRILCRWEKKWASDNSSFGYTSDLTSDEDKHLATHDTLAHEHKYASASNTTMSSSVLPMTDATRNVKMDSGKGTPRRESKRKIVPRQAYAGEVWKSWDKVGLDGLPRQVRGKRPRLT